MPANLSPEYKQAEERFRAAKTPEERLACLEEMLATIPKHKGTEKMQADIKTRIARLRKELTGSMKAGAKRGDWFHIEKQGAGQLVVFGPPNCGKSALVRELTGLPTEVAAYPYTTTRPAAGMMAYEDVQMQLIDTPPLAQDSPPWLFHILRTSDLMLWCLDLSDDALLETTEEGQRLLAEHRITFEPGADTTVKPILRLGTKSDNPQAQDRLAILREFIGDVAVHLVSVETKQGLVELRRLAFDALGLLRVYTKKPGKPPDMDDPVVLRRGSSVLDAALHLHKDFARNLEYARLWNSSGIEGLRVERSHILNDRDVVEFHIQS
uniref:TGS domain-containing protein n=1 Tax=candidate division WOR-3 bacterium TaxID=2052148 RepID=A0A7C4CCA0_UNCW3